MKTVHKERTEKTVHTKQAECSVFLPLPILFHPLLWK
jgi:hypothetical protein